MNGTEQDVPQPPQEYPSKEGWIRKKSNNFFCKWPTRYFVLDNKCLYCYVTDSRQQFLGGVNFDKISIHILTNDQSKEIILNQIENLMKNVENSRNSQEDILENFDKILKVAKITYYIFILIQACVRNL